MKTVINSECKDKMAVSENTDGRVGTSVALECGSGLEMMEQDVTPYDFSRLIISNKSFPNNSCDKGTHNPGVVTRLRKGRLARIPCNYTKSEPLHQTDSDSAYTPTNYQAMNNHSAGAQDNSMTLKTMSPPSDVHPYNTRSTTQTVSTPTQKHMIQSFEDLRSLRSLPDSNDFDESDDELKSIHSEASLSSSASRVSFKRKRTTTIAADQEVEALLSRASSSERQIESCGSPSPTQFSPVIPEEEDEGCTDRKRHCSDASDASNRPCLDLEKMQYRVEKGRIDDRGFQILKIHEYIKQEGPTTRQMAAQHNFSSFTPIRLGLNNIDGSRTCIL